LITCADAPVVVAAKIAAAPHSAIKVAFIALLLLIDEKTVTLVGDIDSIEQHENSVVTSRHRGYRGTT
jgi:hypothetical protein